MRSVQVLFSTEFMGEESRVLRHANPPRCDEASRIYVASEFSGKCVIISPSFLSSNEFLNLRMIPAQSARLMQSSARVEMTGGGTLRL